MERCKQECTKLTEDKVLKKNHPKKPVHGLKPKLPPIAPSSQLQAKDLDKDTVDFSSEVE